MEKDCRLHLLDVTRLFAWKVRQSTSKHFCYSIQHAESNPRRARCERDLQPLAHTARDANVTCNHLATWLSLVTLEFYKILEDAFGLLPVCVEHTERGRCHADVVAAAVNEATTFHRCTRVGRLTSWICWWRGWPRRRRWGWESSPTRPTRQKQRAVAHGGGRGRVELVDGAGGDGHDQTPRTRPRHGRHQLASDAVLLSATPTTIGGRRGGAGAGRCRRTKGQQ